MLRRIRELITRTAKSRGSKRKGFLRRLGVRGVTLLELFIVLEIIGFLATIVLSNYYKSKKAAQVAVTVQNIKHVQTALTSYFAMQNTFPGTLNTIWLQFYGGRVVANFEYIGGSTAGNQAGWNFFPSNSADIRFGGPTDQQYCLKSTVNLLPYAQYVYADAATSAKIVH